MDLRGFIASLLGPGFRLGREGLEHLGIKIDPEKNKYRGKQMDISIDWARVRVLVIPTNEELMIARDTKEVIEK